MRQVEEADALQLVCWHLFLRPTWTNDELPIVKSIARRYDAIPDAQRQGLITQARRLHSE